MGRSDANGYWATLVIDPETFEPREATGGELEELADLGIPVERCWIAPGPTMPAHLGRSDQSDPRVIGPASDPMIEGYPPEVAAACGEAYLAGWLDAIEMMRRASRAVPADWKLHGAQAGAERLRDF